MKRAIRPTGARQCVTRFGTPWAAVMLLTASCVVLADNVSKDGAMASCDAATSALKAAVEVKMEWRDTGKMIKSGLALIEKGDFAAAGKMCDKAKFQGDAGVEQARLEAERWQARVPKS